MAWRRHVCCARLYQSRSAFDTSCPRDINNARLTIKSAGQKPSSRDAHNETARGSVSHQDSTSEQVEHELYDLTLRIQGANLKLMRLRTHLYFEVVHKITPVLHRTRFKTALSESSSVPTFTALKYIVFALASLKSTSYANLSEDLYLRSRHIADELEMKVCIMSSWCHMY